MSFILISLFNTRFCSHLVSFHFFFSKNKVSNFTCDLLFSFQISELRMWIGLPKKYHKNSQVNGCLRENVSVFFFAPLLSRRNVGRTSKESICFNTRISDLG